MNIMTTQIVAGFLIVLSLLVLWKNSQVRTGRHSLAFITGGIAFLVIAVLFGAMSDVSIADSLTLRDWSWGSIFPLCIGYALILSGAISAIRNRFRNFPEEKEENDERRA